MNSQFWAILCLVAASFVSGCVEPAQPGPPPLTSAVREAWAWGGGLVMGLTNPSREQPCTIIAVSVQSDSDVERRSYRLDRTIRPLDSITIGWIECDGFELKQGDRVWIHCKEFQQDLELQVEYKTESWFEWIANKVS